MLMLQALTLWPLSPCASQVSTITQISLKYAHATLACVPEHVKLLGAQHFGNGTTFVKNAYLVPGVSYPIDDCAGPPSWCHLCPGKKIITY